MSGAAHRERIARARTDRSFGNLRADDPHVGTSIVGPPGCPSIAFDPPFMLN
jgi:hypothetical protein